MDNSQAEASAPAAPPPGGRRGRRLSRSVGIWTLRVVLLCFLAVALTLAWWRHDPPDLMPHAKRIARVIRDETGLKVTFTGLKLNVDLAPEVEVEGLLGRPRQSTDVVVSAARVLLRFSPRVWLKGGGMPLEMVVQHPSVILERDGDGKIRLGTMTLYEPGKGDKGDGRKEWPVHFFTISGANVVFTDRAVAEVDGKPVQIQARNVRFVSGLGWDGAWELEGSGEMLFRQRSSHFRVSSGRDEGGKWRFSAGVGPVQPAAWQPYVGEGPLKLMNLPVEMELSNGAYLPDGSWQAAWQARAGRGELDLTPLFRWPIPVVSLKGEGNLSGGGGQGMDFVVDSFEAATDKGKAKGRLLLGGVGGSSPYMDLEATAAGEPADRAPFYYPAGIMSKDLVHWLDSSIHDGFVREARVRIKGPLHGIPFDQPPFRESREVSFRIDADVEGATLHYYPGLPPIRNLKTHLVFDRISMGAEVFSGAIGKSREVKGTVRIADMVHDPVVEVRARARADLKSAWEEVVAAEELGWDKAMHLQGASARGEGNFEFSMDLPMFRLADATYSGRLETVGAAISFPFLGKALEEVAATLRFDPDQLAIPDFAGKIGESPVKGALEANAFRDPSRFSWNLAGETRLDGGELASHVASLLGPDGRMRGVMPTRFRLSGEGNRPGMAVEIAADGGPLALLGRIGWRKEEGEASRLELSGRIDWEGNLEAERFGGQVGNYTLAGKGRFRLENDAFETPALDLTLNGDLTARDLHWIFAPLLGREGTLNGGAPLAIHLGTPKPGGKSPFSFTVDARDLEIAGRLGWRKAVERPGELFVTGVVDREGKIDLTEARANLGNLEARGEGSWHMSREEGEVRIPEFRLGESRGRLVVTRKHDWEVTADLKKLDLAPLLEKSDLAREAEPVEEHEELVADEAPLRKEDPASRVRFKAVEVQFANEAQGRDLEMALSLRGGEVNLESFRVSQSSGKILTGDGQLVWREHVGWGPYQGKLHLETDDLGHVVRALDWSRGMEGGRGTLGLELVGSVPRGDVLRHHLTGAGKLQAYKGAVRRFKLFFQLLGLLSIDEIPELLSGDRPDLAAEGFYYDRMEGAFTLAESVLHSDAFTLDGPSLRWLVSGKVDLPGERLELLVRARPLETLDNLVNRVPVLGSLVSGSRHTLYETQWDVTGSFEEPDISLKTASSLAPGIVLDILQIPGKLLGSGGEEEKTEEKKEGEK